MNIHTHRNREANLITAVIALVCALGCASALVPGVEHAVTLGLLGLGGPALAGTAVRLTARWLRERREDRADAITAAAWRAENARAHLDRPHPLDAIRAGSGRGVW